MSPAFNKTAAIRERHRRDASRGAPIGENFHEREDLRNRLTQRATANLSRLCGAVIEENTAEVLRELARMESFVISTAISFGWDIDAAFHRMLRAPDGAPVDLSDLVAEPGPPLPYPWCSHPRRCRGTTACHAKPVCTE